MSAYFFKQRVLSLMHSHEGFVWTYLLKNCYIRKYAEDVFGLMRTYESLGSSIKRIKKQNGTSPLVPAPLFTILTEMYRTPYSANEEMLFCYTHSPSLVFTFPALTHSLAKVGVGKVTSKHHLPSCCCWLFCFFCCCGSCSDMFCFMFAPELLPSWFPFVLGLMELKLIFIEPIG